MRNLIRAELFKLKKSTAYKALILIYFIIEIAVQMNNISNSVVYPKYNPTYTGMEWLMNSHQTAMPLYSIVVFLFAAFFVNGDIVGHTFHIGLLCGIPRKNIFWAKLIAVFVGVIPLMFVSMLTGTVLWSIHAGPGMDFSAGTVLRLATAFARYVLSSVMLISNAALFSVIVKSKIGTFVWSFGTLYILGVLRANIERIIQIPILCEILLILLSLSYLNLGTFLVSILLKLLAAGYIFERMDFK